VRFPVFQDRQSPLHRRRKLERRRKYQRVDWVRLAASFGASRTCAGGEGAGEGDGDGRRSVSFLLLPPILPRKSKQKSPRLRQPLPRQHKPPSLQRKKGSAKIMLALEEKGQVREMAMVGALFLSCSCRQSYPIHPLVIGGKKKQAKEPSPSPAPSPPAQATESPEEERISVPPIIPKPPFGLFGASRTCAGGEGAGEGDGDGRRPASTSHRVSRGRKDQRRSCSYIIDTSTSSSQS
jgi:hypothetical protein